MTSKFFAKTLGFMLLVVATGSVHSQDPPRLTVTVFQYHGTSTEPGQQTFGEFLGILDDKIRNLGQELSLSHNDATYLQNLQMFASTDFPPVQLQGFAAHSASIGLLSGTVFSQETPTVVRSRYFLGDLRGNVGLRSLSLTLSIGASEFGSTRDSHSAAILYALAMDAKRLHLSREVIVECLSRAYSALEDLDTNDSEIMRLKTAIQEEFQALQSSQ